MFAAGSPDPSREESPATVLTASNAKVAGKKRKRVPGAASSPAPSDLGNASQSTPPPESRLSANGPLAKYRDPIFVPIAEGSEYYNTEQLPMNRMGFRYIPAGATLSNGVLTCHTTETTPASYRVSWEDRSPFVKVTKDGLGLLGDKGFRSARCNAPIREGSWYMEVKIERGGGEHSGDNNQPEGSHVRLGWGRREAPLNGPVGLDGYSYGIRDKSGEKVTLSRPRPYGRPFKSGDVVGMYISLPPRRKASPKDPSDPAHLKRQRIAIDLRGQTYFEALEYPQCKEMTSLMDYSGKSTSSASVPSSSKKSATVKNLPERGRPKATQPEAATTRPLPTLSNSLIAFFVNGEFQGAAFEDLYDYLPLKATDSSRKVKEKRRTRDNAHEHKENPFDDGQLGYYPFISLYNYAKVRINPGPDFDYPPPPNMATLLVDDAESKEEVKSKERAWRPICERYAEFMEEEWALDEIDIAEAKAEAARRALVEKQEADKREQRQKKRAQAEARKKKKLAQPAATPPLDDDRFGPNLGSLLSSTTAQPSPLRHGVAYQYEDLDKEAQSPAPTVASMAEAQDIASGYNSEFGDGVMGEVVDEALQYRYMPSPQPSDGPSGILEQEEVVQSEWGT